MPDPVPVSLDTPVNARVLAFVAECSAHSDIASALQQAVRPLGDVQRFCPDPAAYRYVIVSTKGVVFGFAIGTSTIAFRLDPRMRARAVQTGGDPCPACGPEWVAVCTDRSDSDWPAVDVAFWARKAYVFARGTV